VVIFFCGSKIRFSEFAFILLIYESLRISKCSQALKVNNLVHYSLRNISSKLRMFVFAKMNN